MIVGVNGRFLIKPYTGIASYTINLFNTLSRLFPQNTYYIVVPEMIDPQKNSIKFSDNVKIVVLPIIKFGTAGIKKTFWEQVQLPFYFRSINANIVHFPYPSNPWSKLFWKSITKAKVAVTVHDTIPWTEKDYKTSISTRLYQFFSKRSVKKADIIFTVSKNSKKEICDCCKVDDKKIVVTYNAVNACNSILGVDDKRVLTEYKNGHKNKYILYVGGYDKRKNVNLLVKAYKQSEAEALGVELLLVGGKLFNSSLYESFDSILTNGLKKGKLTSENGLIKSLGFVSDETLSVLYKNAYLFITPSTKEGFNIPLLEAIMAGTVTVASDIPVHKEITDNKAIYFKNNSEKDLIQIINKLLTDHSLYQKEKQNVLNYKCPYSWAETAKKTDSTYKAIL